MLEIPNYSVVIPQGEDISLQLEIRKKPSNRREHRGFITLFNQTTATLPFTPLCTEWLQVFDAFGRVVLNPRLKSRVGGSVHETYNVVGNIVTFSSPQKGYFTVVADTQPLPELDVNVIKVQNTQGFLTSKASLFVEPIIVTEPANGYARLSADRKSMVYLQSTGFYGSDSFSYCLINNHGQYSKNYCVDIFIPAPPNPKDPK